MIDLVTDALAVFRLTRLVTTDAIMQPARDAIQGRPFVREVTSCDWCLSVWVAFGVVTARAICPRVWRPIAQALAFSTVAGLIAEHS